MGMKLKHMIENNKLMKRKAILSQIKEICRRKELLLIEISQVEKEKARMELSIKQLDKDLDSLLEEL